MVKLGRRPIITSLNPRADANRQPIGPPASRVSDAYSSFSTVYITLYVKIKVASLDPFWIKTKKCAEFGSERSLGKGHNDFNMALIFI